jgi:hypothetical protein
MSFEPDTVFLRRVCWGRTEVLRGIYAAVRDQNWGTVPPRILDFKSQISADSFALSFDVDCEQREIHFHWHGEVTGAEDGTVKFSFAGEALTTFLRNRIGLCVLHPVRECAGVAARQRRTDGSVVECRFPRAIEPQIFGQSSFCDLRAVAHEVAPGLWAEVQFAGDVFEMEDQRNWTDASFKTYCTPLAHPFPVEVPAGTHIRQEVMLRLVGCASTAGVDPIRASEAVPTLTLPTRPGAALPRLGLGIAADELAATASATARLSALRLAHLRHAASLGEDRWQPVLRAAIRQAGNLELPLELAIHLPATGGEAELATLRTLLTEDAVRVACVLALRQGEPATSAETVRVVRQQLEDLVALIGGGTDAHFCELNREHALRRFALAEADFVSWPITPQVHAFDDLSVMETIEAQADTLASARGFAEGKPLMISPLTLKPRFNAVAIAPGIGQPTPPVDPRQRSLFGAAWTLGSIAALARGGAASATYFATTGPGGVMDEHAVVYPVYHVLAWLAGFTAWAALPGLRPDAVAALAVFAPEGRRRLLLGNLGLEPVLVKLPANEKARVVILDETTVSLATQQLDEFLHAAESASESRSLGAVLRLRAHAIARIDFA